MEIPVMVVGSSLHRVVVATAAACVALLMPTAVAHASWVARPYAGVTPLARAAQRSPVINCNASIRHSIGGVRFVHDEGGHALTLRRVGWTVKHSCTGASALAFQGNPDLHRASGDYLLSYGKPYNDAFGSGPDGRIRLIERNHWYEPSYRRRKRVVWHSTITVPPPYQWISDKPFGKQRGIDPSRSSCRRTTDGGLPAYLNVLKCKLVSYRFR